MRLLKDATEEKKLDIRMVEKNLRRGFLTDEENKASNQALPDDADNVHVVTLDSLVDNSKL